MTLYSSSVLVEYLDDEGVARAAAELQSRLHRHGEVLAARDAFISGAAMAHDERLAVADSDFDIDGLTELVDVDAL